jgi:hypothetical protein
MHGADTSPRGGREIEVYDNTVNCINTASGCASGLLGQRSGVSRVYNNTLTGASGAFFSTLVQIMDYRTVFTIAPWGACGGSGAYDTNDGTVYYTGTNSGSSGATVLTDSSKSWTTNQLVPTGAPYSVYDVTQGWWAEIASNTATTLTIASSIPEQVNTFNSGDSYQILRSTVCVDQPGRGAGVYLSGTTGFPTTPPTPSGLLNQALDPIYEWNDPVSVIPVFGCAGGGAISPSSGKLIANRDYYQEPCGEYTGTGGNVQTSATSPFNGTSGTGHGTLAFRPTSCSVQVGYWATDTNTLYLCKTANTWTASYTPYTYPHPLTSSGMTYTLGTSTAGTGTGTVTGCAGSYASGTAYSCTVTATGGSSLTSVSGCSGSGTTTFSGNMPASNCTVTATFTAPPSGAPLPPTGLIAMAN